MGHQVHLEIEKSQELGLLHQDVFCRNGPVRDLFVDNFGMQWIDIFVFGGQIHRCDTDGVNLFVDYSLTRSPHLD